MCVPNLSFLACLEVARLDKLARLARLEGLQNNLDSILYPNSKLFKLKSCQRYFI